MEIEYSNKIQGAHYSYSFADWEKKHIADGLKPIIKKLAKKIVKIEQDPDNEGQVTFQVAIEEVEKEIQILSDIVKQFTEKEK